MNMELKYETKIHTTLPPDILWAILTKPEYTTQYLFNCAVASDWVTGHPITWRGYYMGYDAFQKDTILECQAPYFVKYSTFDPNFGYEDKEENYVYVTYILEKTKIGTDLIIRSDNFGGDVKRYEDTAKGWDEIVIPQLKNIITKNA